jgi:hypothetical protein
MHLITGFDYLLSCTTKFESTVGFMRDVLGLEITEQGIPRNDTRFSRHATVAVADGRTLEIVELAHDAEYLDGQQILCFTVPDVTAARDELERRGAAFVGDTIDDGEGLGWFYLQAPGEVIYQVYGPVGVREGQS